VLTVIVATVESTVPAGFDTRTQNLVVSVSGGVVRPDSVAPGTGSDVDPESLRNH
jgi:hypothetical protein